MSKSKRKFELEEKLQILREGETNGVEVTTGLRYDSRSLSAYSEKLI
jgi:hypothetical protein